MAEIKQWHNEAAKEIAVNWWGNPTHSRIDEAARFIAAHDPHAPTPAPTEVIEKYARSITVNSPDIGKEFDAGVEVSEVATAILTRFASEIGTVDAEKVDDAIRTIRLLMTPADAQTSRMLARVLDFLRSIKSTGGGKDGNNG